MEEEINNYMKSLVYHVKNCEVSAGRGRRISIEGKKLSDNTGIGFAIHVTGSAVEFGSRFVEIIIEHIYRHKISKKIKKKG
jgi:hypothetical protein